MHLVIKSFVMLLTIVHIFVNDDKQPLLKFAHMKASMVNFILTIAVNEAFRRRMFSVNKRNDPFGEEQAL